MPRLAMGSVASKLAWPQERNDVLFLATAFENGAGLNGRFSLQVSK